jgi:hypothetical protein
MKCTSQKKADLIRIFRIYICFSCSYSAFSSTLTLNAHFLFSYFRNWIFRLHCLGVSSLLFDELARSSSRVLLALCTFCLYIVIIRMPMSFLRVHLCLHKCFCMHHVSKYACLHVHIFDLQHSNAAQPRCGLAMCRIKQKLSPGSHQVSSCHHTYTFPSACMLKSAIVIP